MISIHLSANGKHAIIDPELIMFAEDCDGTDKDKKPIQFTRIYLTQSLPGEDGSIVIDIQENAEKLMKMMKKRHFKLKRS